MAKKSSREQRIIRHKRIRARVKGTMECPRLSVFRSQKHLYAQLVDDIEGKVIIAISDLKLKKTSSRVEGAATMGKLLAKNAKDKGVLKVVFDRGGYKYHGSVKAVAEGAREGGLQF
ncbi:50S ribosomal protein L18 [Patescibacteria group bacterium]|nr:50S ribosomal protein L18 [Patescibacteria group bacterium]